MAGEKQEPRGCGDDDKSGNGSKVPQCKGRCVITPESINSFVGFSRESLANSTGLVIRHI